MHYHQPILSGKYGWSDGNRQYQLDRRLAVLLLQALIDNNLACFVLETVLIVLLQYISVQRYDENM